MLGCSLRPKRRGISAALGMDAIARLVDHVVITVHRINQAGCHGCFASTECAVALLGTRPDYFTLTLNQPVSDPSIERPIDLGTVRPAPGCRQFGDWHRDHAALNDTAIGLDETGLDGKSATVADFALQPDSTGQHAQRTPPRKRAPLRYTASC